jgi:arylsulfatase A-like enzyme
VGRGETWPFIEYLTTGAGDGGVPSDADLRHLMDLYDAEVRAVDGAVGQLVAELERRSLMDRTLLVILSDHGESFLENGVLQHSFSLYQTELHVPWILHWRGRWSRARRIPGPVCSVDVMPTVVALAGLPPPSRIDGIPVLDAEGRRIGAPRMCMSAGRSNWRDGTRTLAALRSGSFKLIHDSEHSRWELYDVARDPAERRSLLDAPGSSAWLHRYFRAALEGRIGLLSARGRPGSKHVALTSEAEQALRALGYVQ